MKIQNMMTYPNPFNNITHFVFDHNHPGETLKASITIYNTAGYLVRNIEQSFVATGSRSSDISWDGTTNYGIQVQGGVYLCRIKIATEKGIEDMTYQKVVFIR